MKKIYITSLRKVLLRAVVYILMAGTLLMVTGCKHKEKMWNPRAEQGVFDLRGYFLSGDKTVNLDGEWEFYWDQLLTPDDFKSTSTRPKMTGYFPMHRAWTGFELEGKRLGGSGQATFRLSLQPDWPSGSIVLRVFDIHEAYRLWADGVLIAQCGVPGRSAKTETPGRSLELAKIAFNGHPVELVLQVSNHHFRIGGAHEPIMAALPGTFETARARDWGLALFFAGCMLIMGIYHIVLFVFRSRYPAPLYFGVYCLLVVGYSVSSNTSQWVASEILPWWNHEIMEYFSLACFVVWPSLLFRFLKTLFPNEFHSFLVYFLDARIVVFLCLLFFARGAPLYWFIAFCLLQTMCYAAYYLHRVGLCVLRKRRGSGFLLAGLTVQFLVGLNDALTHTGLIKSIYLAEPAVCFFVLTQSLALAKRFSASFDSVETLSLELENKNVSLHAEIKNRNRLEQKVVNISEEERRRISHELHDGLCQQLTGARLQASVLAQKHKQLEDGQALADLVGLLQESTDDAYKTARGLWPVEHDATMPGPSLEDLGRRISKATGINVTFDKQCYCETCTNSNITTLYRIAQEALTNSAKHSQAKNIHLSLRCSGKDHVELSVQDDGIGRGAAGSMHGGLGMDIMAHRAKVIEADLRIEDVPEGGTRVTCVAPCAI